MPRFDVPRRYDGSHVEVLPVSDEATVDVVAAALTEQQMVVLAQALVSRPSVVLVDELSLGLAPAVIDEIYRAIEQIRSWQISLVLIEQNAYRALAVADRAYVLERGSVTYVGAPDALEDENALRNAYFGDRSTGDQARKGTNEEESLQ